MTSTAATADHALPTTRTGGPDDESNALEHILGWTLVVVLAMLITQVGLL
ncbi:SCO1431 family membrane protein [Streptomyces sp. NPDC006274]